MGGFLGNIIGRVISRMIMMALIVGGGHFYVSQNGGIAGVLGGGSSTPGAVQQPISAGFGGLGAIASSLGIGNSTPPTHYEAQGRISAIREECRLVRTVEGKIQRTEPLSCDRARTALTYPQFSAYTLSEARIATYIYYDKSGIDVLTGKADATRGQRVGDVIDLSIEHTNPRKSTPL